MQIDWNEDGNPAITVEHARLGVETGIERRSVHGPVKQAPDGTLVALRSAGLHHAPVTSALEAWWQMSLAETVPDLFAAQDRWPLPMFSIIAADSAGSIGAAFCGATPRRPGGGFDDVRRRLPGDDPARIWVELNPPSSLSTGLAHPTAAGLLFGTIWRRFAITPDDSVSSTSHHSPEDHHDHHA